MMHNTQKAVLLCMVMLAAMPAYATGNTALYYWVGFKDKAATTYSITQPEEYLSQRAIERRQRLHIAIDSLDLPVCQQYIDAVTATGAVRHNTNKWLNGMTVMANRQTAERIRQLPCVKEVLLCLSRDMSVDNIPATYDRGTTIAPLPHTEALDSNYYHLCYPQIAMLNGIALHQQGYEGQGVWIGVCDGGFPGVDTIGAFKTLRDEHRIIATRDFMLHRTSAYRGHEHGTFVLSCIASDQPGLNVGTAPKANYVLCLTEDTPTESPLEELNWGCAMEYLDSIGVDVVTTSLGYIFFDDTTHNYTAADFDGKTSFMTRAANIAASRGILCVNAAGNYGDQPMHELLMPNDADNILSIGATQFNGKIAYFSSYGPTADGRVKPDITSPGVDVICAAPTSGHFVLEGTSIAAPIAAGLVACLRQAMPTASVSQMWNAIRLSADHAQHVNNIYGYGTPDFAKALQLLRADVNNLPLHDTLFVHDTVVDSTACQTHRLTVSSANTDCGVAAGNGTFTNGTAVEIAAIPLEGYQFYAWSDGDTNNPRIVVVESDTTFIANFQYYNVGIAATNAPSYEATAKGGAIQLQGAAGQRVRLFDAVGRLIKEEQSAADMLQIAVPATGVYLLQVAEWPARRITVVR